MISSLYIREPGSTGVIRVDDAEGEPAWENPVCFLIHGYNTTAEGAHQSFTSLLQTLRKETGLPPLLGSQSFLLCWPGYASGGLASGKSLHSPITYANQVPSAKLAAQALRTYIDSHAGAGAHITLIAHSLGCRLALELLDAYAALPPQHSRPHFPLLILMAAAVPTYFFLDLSRLWKGALLPSRQLILHSKEDRTLNRYFPAGQTLCGEGFFPKAVGATGHPLQGFWTRTELTENDHSDYFEDPLVAREIARSLGVHVPQPLPIARVAYSIGQGAIALPSVALPSRRIGGGPI